MNRLMASVVLLTAVAAAYPFGVAQAVPITCNLSVADGTSHVYTDPGQQTAVSECYIDSAAFNDEGKFKDHNAYSYFGFADWELAEFTGDRTGQSGGWAITDPDFGLNDYMIIFKSGQGTALVGFLFNEEFDAGLWISPFTEAQFPNAPGRGAKDVSHWNIYFREAEDPDPDPGPEPIPEPGTLALFGTALAGLWALRRRTATGLTNVSQGSMRR